MIAMAIGQAFLAIVFSWIASASSLKNLDDYRTKVELPLWFAILPTVTALGVSVHLWLSRHVDRACPWVNLGWIILAVNIVALMLFIQMTR
jgi:hypothetical protein